MTITLQIGNSDDKLTQRRWHDYVQAVRQLLESHPAVQIHFFGAPPNHEPWQNAAWVFVADPRHLSALRDQITALRAQFQQDSVAWTEGETHFL